MSNRLVRDDLSGVEEHIDAMVAALTPSESAIVLESALRKYLGGQLVTCSVHPGRDMTFQQLHVHLGRQHHQPGDIRPADPDPIQARRLGGDR